MFGEDEELDALHEQRWAALISAAPEYVPITDDVPQEYLEGIERDNAVYEKVLEQVEQERNALMYRQEKNTRKKRQTW